MAAVLEVVADAGGGDVEEVAFALGRGGGGLGEGGEGEESEDTDLAGGTCEALGLVGGTLSCGGGCAYDSSGCGNLPAPALMLSFSSIKRFDFGWAAVAGADHYQLEERVAPGQPFVQVGGDIVDLSISLTMPLHLRHEASYRLRACNVEGCSSSAVVDVMSSLAEAVGYFKASNTGASDRFGTSVALSGDGNTLAVGANAEDSNATGIEGGQANNSASDSGAVYVFVRDGVGGWSQQAYVKASNTGANDRFGGSVALSWDGNTLAVGASAEQSAATGIGGDQTDDSADWAGAVYVFGRDGAGAWSQQAYVKASNTDAGDAFGSSVVLSEDGDTLAVGARGEASAATGIDGDEDDDSVPDSGAVYVFGRDGVGAWSQQAYVKASNPDQDDWFGDGVALSWDGDTLAVGAPYESSGAPGIDGDQADDSISQAGAVYVFARDEAGAWSQAAYVKASNPGVGDRFGAGVALSEDGSTLAVGALYESSNATGIDGDQANDAAFAAGAVYVFVRDGADAWSQAAYVKASNTGSLDAFGSRVALSGDGNTLAVAAMREDGDATGLDGDQGSDALADAGAAYVFVRDGASTWSQAAYVKAPNTDEVDWFGLVALSGDGNTLAVCASREESNATGVGGNQASNAANDSGAVYLY